MNRVNIPAWAIDLGKSRSGLCALTAFTDEEHNAMLLNMTAVFAERH